MDNLEINSVPLNVGFSVKLFNRKQERIFKYPVVLKNEIIGFCDYPYIVTDAEFFSIKNIDFVKVIASPPQQVI